MTNENGNIYFKKQNKNWRRNIHPYPINMIIICYLGMEFFFYIFKSRVCC